MGGSVPKSRKMCYNGKSEYEIVLLNVIKEAYIFGVSRYKINELVKILGCELNEHADEFKKYPFKKFIQFFRNKY